MPTSSLSADDDNHTSHWKNAQGGNVSKTSTIFLKGPVRARDLSNSASQSFIADYVAGFCLAESGEDDAHEIIRKITLAAEKEKCSFSEAPAGVL
ncbi:MAG: hypothetical protein LBS48_02495 [Treponema sp.]|jgi:hypothetical protein|nr:hypothetical protein [Treponema sp.]